MTPCESTVLTEDFYKTLLDSLFDAVCTVDAAGTITYWNASCERLTGYSAAEVVGQSHALTVLSHEAGKGGDGQRRRGGVAIVLETGMPGTWKGHVRRKNGQQIPIESHISPLRDKEGRNLGAVEIFRDISAQVGLEETHRQVLQMSRRDQLTGLYNRSAISSLLKAEIERSRRYHQPLSVVMMDIDFFKRVNDTYGHDMGDKVLAKFGAVLKFNLRQPDAVGRWGGEEFLIVAPGGDGPAAVSLAERMRLLVRETAVEGIAEVITASFGAAELVAGQNHDEILFAADMALYEAKEQGRDRVVQSTAGQGVRSAAVTDQ